MERRWSILIRCIALFFICVEVFGVQLGMSVQEVERSLGPPNGTRQLADGEIWVYSNGIFVEFTNGRVSRLRGLDTGIANDVAPAPTIPPATPAIPAAEPPAPVPNPAEEVVEEIEVEPEVPEAVPLEDPEEATEFADDLWGEGDFDEEAYDERPGWQIELERIGMGFVIPVLMNFIFLLIAFHWVGAIADKWSLVLIAIVDRIVVISVEFLFLSILEFPVTFQAEHLASVLIMIPLIVTLTHAKELPTAIQVVVATKVASAITVWTLWMVLLHVLF